MPRFKQILVHLHKGLSISSNCWSNPPGISRPTVLSSIENKWDIYSLHEILLSVLKFGKEEHEGLFILTILRHAICGLISTGPPSVPGFISLIFYSHNHFFFLQRKL